MIESTQIMPLVRHLIHDEIESLLSARGTECSFRIRVWRSKGTAPVVLVSQVAGGTKPSWMTNKLANYAYSALVGFCPDGILYFDDEEAVFGGENELFQCFFEVYGNAPRLRLLKPSRKIRSWTYLESLVGQNIEP